MSLRLLLIIIFVLTVNGIQARELPRWFSVCKESDRMLTKCVKNLFMMFQPQLDTGVQELHIAPAEPLVLPILMLKETTMKSNYMTTLMNLKVYGVTSYKIKDIRGEMEEGKVTLRLTIPLIKLSADYEAKGEYEGAHVKASGKFHANLTKCTVDVKIKGQEGGPNEDEYFLMNDIKVSISIGMAKGYFTSLSHKNNDLDLKTNAFLSASSLEMLQEIRPAVEMLIKKLIEDVGTKFAAFHAYNEMFRKT